MAGTTKSKSTTSKSKTPKTTKSKSEAPKKPAAAKRELIDTGRDKRYVRRDDKGEFKESDDVGRSLSQDRKRKAKTAAKPGQGDKGDRKPSATRKSP